jgi:hypothetical protein
MGAERVLGAGFVGLPLSEQIGGQDGESLGQRRHDALPGLRAAGDAVHEQQHRPFAGHSVGDPVAVDGDRTQFHRFRTRRVPAHASRCVGSIEAAG